MQNIDPYQVLQIPKHHFTLEMLKHNYKKLALQMHPDKSNPTSVAMFQVLTNCYKQLVKEHARRQTDKSHMELKQQAATEAHQNHQSAPSSSSVGSKFDASRFNRLFNENHVADVYASQGYGSWMESSESFQQKNKKQLILRQEPDALQSSMAYSSSKRMGAAEFQELGIDRVKDFTGTNVPNSQLQFMDYRLAHTTDKLLDPDLIPQRKEFRSVQDLETARAQNPNPLTEAEIRALHEKKVRAELRERKRLELMSMQDQQSLDHYQRVNKLMLRQG